MKDLRRIALYSSLVLLPLLALDPALPQQCSSGVASVTLPTWPDASRYWGVLLNTNDSLSTYLTNHPANFSQDTLVTDFEVQNVDYTSPTAIPNASAVLTNTLTMLTARGIALGSYISGTNVEPFANEDRYPYSIVRLEDMPATAKYIGNWGSSAPWRQFIDPADSATTTAFHNRIAADWSKLPAGIHWRFVDNSASLTGGSYGAWSDQMNNVHAINLLAQSQDARVIFNMSIIFGAISPANMNLLLSAVSGGGICLEAPWSSSISSSASATASAVAQYRQVLDAGIGIVMIGAGSSTPTQATAAQLKAWVKTWRKPTDHLYLSRHFFEAPDLTIYDWP